MACRAADLECRWKEGAPHRFIGREIDAADTERCGVVRVHRQHARDLHQFSGVAARRDAAIADLAQPAAREHRRTGSSIGAGRVVRAAAEERPESAGDSRRPENVRPPGPKVLIGSHRRCRIRLRVRRLLLKIPAVHSRGSGTIAHSPRHYPVPGSKVPSLKRHAIGVRGPAGARLSVAASASAFASTTRLCSSDCRRNFPPGSKATSRSVDRLCSLRMVETGRAHGAWHASTTVSTTAWPPFDVDTELDCLRSLFEY